MAIPRNAISGLAALSALVMVSTVSSAQPPRDRMPGMGMMGMGLGMMGAGCRGFGPGKMGRGPGRGMMHGWSFDPAKVDELIDERLKELKSELGIGEKQQKAWEAYVQAVKDRITTMRGMHDARYSAMQERDAVERMEIRIGIMENMLESMKALLPATKALYESLPKDKRDNANALLGGCGML